MPGGGCHCLCGQHQDIACSSSHLLEGRFFLRVLPLPGIRACPLFVFYRGKEDVAMKVTMSTTNKTPQPGLLIGHAPDDEGPCMLSHKELWRLMPGLPIFVFFLFAFLFFLINAL